VDERRPGVWRLRVEGPADPLTGQRQRVSRTVYVQEKRQAQKELAKLLADKTAKPRRASKRAKTVADACESWLNMFDTLAATGKKSPATAKRFRDVIDWYVLPTLGSRMLRSLSTESINALY
jgi:hypothetical protein